MVDSGRSGELGEFLRTRRARIRPEDVGLVSYGARRVPGLRREELAQLAGVSATYYTRLEQGQSRNASDSVIDAIARALDLDDAEVRHLRDLARPAMSTRVRQRRQVAASPAVRQLVAAMGDVPAVVLSPSTDVLAWNPLGHRLLAGHLDAGAPDRRADRPNLMRMLFLDAHTRELYRRWDEEARRAVASLRLVAGRFQDDRALAELVGELSMKSLDFDRLWAAHPVATCDSGAKYLRHPEVGDLDLEFEALHLADDSGVRIVAYSAAAGSPSEAALQLLRTTFGSAVPVAAPAPWSGGVGHLGPHAE